jgi:hypothetical protein
MVTRIFTAVLCLVVMTSLPAMASYCGPMGCPPQKDMAPPMPGFQPMPMQAAMPVPGPMMGAPNCPPPCPPPMCGPKQGDGFNPLSAIFSVITFPFRLLGGLSSNNCQPMCPPPSCVPMCAPQCGPPPITKCKPEGLPKRASAVKYSPMGY